MSRFRFQAPTEEEAREFLARRRQYKIYQAESYEDTLACERRLRPVTTPEERRANRQFNERRKKS